MTMGMKREINITSICAVAFILSLVRQNSCASMNDTKVLLRDILEGYNKNVRPVKSQNDAIHVNATLMLFSVQELDEIRGIFSVMGILSMEWHDANMIWNPQTYGGVEYVLTSYIDVWVPELILINTAEESDTLGKKWQRVHFYHSGYASWWPGDLIKSTCALNVYIYPFDTQECIISFGAWGYFPGQVKISSGSEQVNLRYYTESSTWKLAKSKITTLYEGTQIHFHVYLERKPGYVIVNIILPLTFLSLLNAFVFLLVPESGERISYCITVLLSIAVFMTIVSETLPKSSEPVPVISFKLMFDMAISSLMTLVTILNLRLYNRNDTENVPYWLQSIYSFLSCKRPKSQIEAIKSNANGVENGRMQSKADNGNVCQSRKVSKQWQSGTITDVQNSRKASVYMLDLEDVSSECIENQTEENDGTGFGTSFQVSWKNISNMVDGIAFIVFTLLSVCSLVVFMYITSKY